jgi:integrase
VSHTYELNKPSSSGPAEWVTSPFNPSDFVDAPKRVRKPVASLDARGDRVVNETLSGVMDHFSTAVLLALMTGMREGEHCALRWPDVGRGGPRRDGQGDALSRCDHMDSRLRAEGLLLTEAVHKEPPVMLDVLSCEAAPTCRRGGPLPEWLVERYWGASLSRARLSWRRHSRRRERALPETSFRWPAGWLAHVKPLL